MCASVTLMPPSKAEFVQPRSLNQPVFTPGVPSCRYGEPRQHGRRRSSAGCARGSQGGPGACSGRRWLEWSPLPSGADSPGQCALPAAATSGVHFPTTNIICRRICAPLRATRKFYEWLREHIGYRRKPQPWFIASPDEELAFMQRKWTIRLRKQALRK